MDWWVVLRTNFRYCLSLGIVYELGYKRIRIIENDRSRKGPSAFIKKTNL